MLKIFISSTIYDLSHLREAVREQVEELGHQPVMSEFGDIGWLPSTNTEESCYIAMAGCDLAVVIIAKRCGKLSGNGVSVTQNEYRTAVKNQIPVICLVESEVMSFKRVSDSNDGKIESFPGMDNHNKTFAFIEEVSNQPLNNGIVQFTSGITAKAGFKKQLNLVFKDLVKKNFSKSQADINEILAEVVTLRKALLGDKSKEAYKYIQAYQLLTNYPKFTQLRYALQCHGPLEDQIPSLLASKSLEDYFKSEGCEKVLRTDDQLREMANCGSTQLLADKYQCALYWSDEELSKVLSPDHTDADGTAPFIAASGGGPYIVNKAGDKHAEELFSELKRMTSSHWSEYLKDN